MRSQPGVGDPFGIGDATTSPVDLRVFAFELMFEMVEMLVSKSGTVRHELVGFERCDDGLVPGLAVAVEEVHGAAPLIREMLQRWPIVARAFQGWAEPSGGPPGISAGRREVVVIVVHTRDSALLATCNIDRSESPEIDPFGLRGRIAARIEKGCLVPMATH